MMRLARTVAVFVSLLTIGCSGSPDDRLAARTPVPLPTRTPVSAFGGCSPLAFTRPATYPIGQAPHSIVVRDLDGDGKPDLVVANPGSGDVSILVNVCR